MARMVGTVQPETFSLLKTFIETELPSIKNNPIVWNAFLHRSGNSDTPNFAEQAIQFGVNPILYVVELGGSFGYFTPAKPNTIHIGKNFACNFQKNNTDVKLRQQIEATVLHEMVHWSLCNKGLKETGDMGVLFEIDAYGKRVLTDTDLMHIIQEELGSLSSNKESKGVSSAIGKDSTGGWSYGLYQLASNQGRIADFIRFLNQSGNAEWMQYSERLNQAGGDPAARAGSLKFQDGWRELAANGGGNFSKAQHDYIKATHYDKFVAGLLKENFNVEQHTRALREVAWSVSVQHGPGATKIFTIPLNEYNLIQSNDDETIIDKIYAERSKVEIYFKNSTSNVRESVLNRFKEERLAALSMLNT